MKHVPDLSSDRGFGSDGRTVRTTDDGTLNEVDENAVETALLLKEAAQAAGTPAAEVIALTLGPAPAVDAVRRALQMGADSGVHVCDDALAGADYAVTARGLAAAVRAQGQVDVLVTGMAALDGLGAVLPSLLAADLGWPQLTVAGEVTLTDGVLIATRDVDGATETWRATPPAVVSVTDVANSPRLARMKEILAARQKPVQTVTAADLGLTEADLTVRTAVRSATRRPEPEPEIVADDGTGGQQLADYLIAHDLLIKESR
ncbi:electron transfer flavoprotein subunit beta/FixA family protein [Ruania zhangjianzhongii]|uniref:electron transfer flavoprotein subunit beta/FixA family protein n=1 Tax=Ruania zhangjianzhongii TaxID=2603206 RepID=UPI002E274B12